MTKTLSRATLKGGVTDSRDRPLSLGDRAVDLNTGLECVLLDHIPELGPESLYVQMVGHGGPEMTYWVDPVQLMKLPRSAA
jgi:hypothetical protein